MQLLFKIKICTISYHCQLAIAYHKNISLSWFPGAYCLPLAANIIMYGFFLTQFLQKDEI